MSLKIAKLKFKHRISMNKITSVLKPSGELSLISLNRCSMAISSISRASTVDGTVTKVYIISPVFVVDSIAK